MIGDGTVGRYIVCSSACDARLASSSSTLAGRECWKQGRLQD